MPSATWMRKLLTGKTHRDLRRPLLLARQGLFISPPLYQSLTGTPEAAFAATAPCPACHRAPEFPAHVFFACPRFAALRQAFDADVITHVAPLLAATWSSAALTHGPLATLLRLFPDTLAEATVRIPDHSTPSANPERTCAHYDPRKDPEVLANGMSLADAKARTAPAPGASTRSARTIIELAKGTLRSRRTAGLARPVKQKDVGKHTMPTMSLLCCKPPAGQPLDERLLDHMDGPNAFMATWTVTTLWHQYLQALANPPAAWSDAAGALDHTDFPTALYLSLIHI